jgi:hypothetical protein
LDGPGPIHLSRWVRPDPPQDRADCTGLARSIPTGSESSRWTPGGALQDSDPPDPPVARAVMITHHNLSSTAHSKLSASVPLTTASTGQRLGSRRHGDLEEELSIRSNSFYEASCHHTVAESDDDDDRVAALFRRGGGAFAGGHLNSEQQSLTARRNDSVFGSFLSCRFSPKNQKRRLAKDLELRNLILIVSSNQYSKNNHARSLDWVTEDQ